jgi:hypothetical protein
MNNWSHKASTPCMQRKRQALLEAPEGQPHLSLQIATHSIWTHIHKHTDAHTLRRTDTQQRKHTTAQTQPHGGTTKHRISHKHTHCNADCPAGMGRRHLPRDGRAPGARARSADRIHDLPGGLLRNSGGLEGPKTGARLQQIMAEHLLLQPVPRDKPLQARAAGLGVPQFLRAGAV